MTKKQLQSKKISNSLEKHTKTHNAYAGIAGTIGGTLIALFAIVALFLPGQGTAILVPTTISLAVLGIILGLFVLKEKKA